MESMLYSNQCSAVVDDSSAVAVQPLLSDHDKLERFGISQLIEEQSKIRLAIDDLRGIIMGLGDAEAACFKLPANNPVKEHLLKEYSYRARLMAEQLCRLTRKLDELTQQGLTMKAAKLEDADDFHPKHSLFLTFSGPVDKTTNFMIPLETLPWAKALLKAVASSDFVLLHGHRQSGKTSALRYIETKAKNAGGVVYYIDMLDSIDSLRGFADRVDSLFQFLAWKMGHCCPEYFLHKEQFSGPDDFSNWVKETHEGAAQAPILLIDEYDAFLEFARRDPRMVAGMNSLIALNRNKSDYSQSELERVAYATPWNKMNIMQTQPFDRIVFRKFASNIYKSHNVVVSPEVVDDILQTTCGHPGLSVWLLSKSVQQAFGMKILVLEDWVRLKRWNFSFELHKTTNMTKLMNLAKNSKKQVGKFLHHLVTLYTAVCKEDREASFLRAIGIAKLHVQPNVLTFTCPIIRDFLLQQLYPPSSSIEQVAIPSDPVPPFFMRSALLKAISFIDAALVSYPEGLSQAAVHAEMFRILKSMFRNQSVTILSESRVLASSDMRCEIWIKNSLVEFGVEIKTECDTSIFQREDHPSVREMVLLNFVRSKADSIVFPINVQTAGWERYPNTCFSLIVVKVTGDEESGFRLRYAVDGDRAWRELP